MAKKISDNFQPARVANRAAAGAGSHVTLEQAVEACASGLPPGWHVWIHVERGAAWVELHAPDGRTFDLDDPDEGGLAAPVTDALEEARQRTKEYVKGGAEAAGPTNTETS